MVPFVSTAITLYAIAVMIRQFYHSTPPGSWSQHSQPSTDIKPELLNEAEFLCRLV